MRLWTIVAAGMLAVVGNANAQQLITTCAASTGKAYYLEPTKDGWVDDGISGGSTSFVRYPNGAYDVIFKDLIGTRAASQDGGTVIKIFESSDLLTIVVSYPTTNAIETYQLILDRDGRGTLIWSNIKYRSGPMGITRGMLMVSNCGR
jgi:hypothetical protein